MSAAEATLAWGVAMMAAGVFVLPEEKHPDRKLTSVRFVYGALMLVGAGVLLGRVFVPPIVA